METAEVITINSCIVMFEQAKLDAKQPIRMPLNPFEPGLPEVRSPFFDNNDDAPLYAAENTVRSLLFSEAVIAPPAYILCRNSLWSYSPVFGAPSTLLIQ